MENLNKDQFSIDNYFIKFLGIIPFIKNNRLIVISGLIIGLIFGLSLEFYKSKQKQLVCEIIFVLDNDVAAGGGLAGLASSLGLGGVVSGGGNMFSGENFKELLKTRGIFRKALLTKVKFGNEEDYFVNICLKHGDLKNNEWKNLPDEFSSYRIKDQQIDNLDSRDINILNTLYFYLKSKTNVVEENPKSNFQTLSVETRNDTLSYVWSKLYLKTVTDFYISTKTKKSKDLLVILDKRVDSLRSALYYTQGKLANYNDQNQQIIFQKARVIAERLQMNSSQLQGMYLDALRNYDNLKFTLVKEAPLLSIIEETELPIVAPEYSWGKFTLLSVIIGFFLSLFISYFLDIYKRFYRNK